MFALCQQLRMDHLQHYLASSGTRQSSLAAQLSITRGYMSELVSGRKVPSLELAFRIERLTDGAVPASCWIPVPESAPADAAPTPSPAEKDAAA